MDELEAEGRLASKDGRGLPCERGVDEDILSSLSCTWNMLCLTSHNEEGETYVIGEFTDPQESASCQFRLRTAATISTSPKRKDA